MNRWVVSQLGAREHYAIPRALSGRDCLSALITDAWAPPHSWWRRVPRMGKLADRYHPDLDSARVHAATGRSVGWELTARARRLTDWSKTIARNHWYQSFAKQRLARLPRGNSTFFSYSYTAGRLLPLCRERGWRTIVGQIDPGPVEERIVAEEHERFPSVVSSWTPAPSEYWDDWRREMEAADHVVVNSPWSKDCLVAENVDEWKISVVPLVYQPDPRPGTLRNEPTALAAGPDARRDSKMGAEASAYGSQPSRFSLSRMREIRALGPGDSKGEKALSSLAHDSPRGTVNASRTEPTFDVLFLGQVNLRKGIARLIEAMRQLKSEPGIRLLLAGPSEVSPALWHDLPNVEYLGPVRRSRVGDLYRSADVFILPTLSDGFALTQLEALAHGLPVISSTRCGDCVVDGENGWRLSDLEPETIAAAILFARQNPLRFTPSTGEAIKELADHLEALA